MDIITEERISKDTIGISIDDNGIRYCGTLSRCETCNGNSFIDDTEKMRDFKELSKEAFLKSYSYLKEQDYNATEIEYSILKEEGKV